MNYRIERDTIGEVKVPADALFGAQTQRARENFQISGLKLPRRFIRAQGIVKLSAARANGALGLLDKKILKAVERAAEEVIKGLHDSHFAVDVYQAGAGTSQNMNANEIIANRAIEMLAGKKGDYSLVHPNDHVNMAQSTNDTIPTALYISSYEAVKYELLPPLKGLQSALQKKAKEFHKIIKSGRTHLQDAVPMRLGQEFGGFAHAIKRDTDRITIASRSLLRLPLGGNAVGTGINAHPRYASIAIREIAKITGIEFKKSENFFEGIQNVNPALELSASLRGLSVTLTKIANDLRLLSSGPRTGFAEIKLPAVQPGSSIMPGKVNPVMAEMLNMVCFQVMGNDTAIAFAAQASQLELNVMMPVIAYNLLWSIEILCSSIKTFTDRCVLGIEADEHRCTELMERSLALATALTTRIGYQRAAEISREAYRTGKTVNEVVVERGVLTQSEASLLLDPSKLAGGINKKAIEDKG
ncbi:MAG TPA: aspartate ammonia-lyase [Nitrospiraceae bacterium]|nr:aspartate ammonia-lyase [Nitrospiraceae bacterium]